MRPSGRLHAFLPLIAAVAGGAACAQTPRDESDPVPEQEVAGTTGGQDDESSGDAFEVPMQLDVPAGETGVPGEMEECAEFSVQATIEQRPADILWVVDNSPSMIEESNAVAERLGEFSSQIVGADIDARVFLLTSYPNPGISPALDTGICIEPPLGGGNCPLGDNNPPTFGHVQANIGSTHSLAKLLETHAQWAPMIRDDSTIHVIVVTDDDSHVDAASFNEQFLALDPRHEGYRLHGIVPLRPCAAADTVGETYIELAEQTGGILGDLCDQEFQPLFDLLTTAVTEGTGLDCDWALPEPPDGLTIDPDSVSVRYEDDEGAVSELVAVEDLAACDGVASGWYYADPATAERVVACPAVCESIQQSESASVQIEVGCATKPVG